MSLSGVARLGPFSCETKKQRLLAVKAPEKDKEEIWGIFSMGSLPDGYRRYIQKISETFHLACQVRTSENSPPAAEKR